MTDKIQNAYKASKICMMMFWRREENKNHDRTKSSHI